MSWGEDADALWALWGLLGVIAIVGGIVAVRALHAYQSRRSTPLLFLGGGLALLAVGMPISWFMAYAMTDNLLWCSLAAAVVILVGFVLILLSLRGPPSSGEPLPEPTPSDDRPS